MKSTVILLPCDSYDEERIYTLLKAGLALAGPLSDLVRKDERILLKPNLLKSAEVDRAVITHQAVVAALARILREEGYEDICLADSPGHETTSAVIRGTGMDTALERYGIPAIDYSEGVRTPFPEGSIAKEFILPKELLEADCVISISKMKTHALERITGAVKNSYGFIYGMNKAMGHTKYPDADSFARMLVDLNRCVAPRLYIMDGIVAMEGNGPGSGDPVPMNVLLLSKDPVALDTVFARLVYLKPASVPTIYHGDNMGLGTCREENIEILLPEPVSLEALPAADSASAASDVSPAAAAAHVASVPDASTASSVSSAASAPDAPAPSSGSSADAPPALVISMGEAVRRFGNPDFNVDRSSVCRNIWTRLAAAAQPFRRRPVIDADKCVRCGICVSSCPVEGKAVDFRNGRDRAPVYDYKKCIRCFCCQEMCPQKAIRVK